MLRKEEKFWREQENKENWEKFKVESDEIDE